VASRRYTRPLVRLDLHCHSLRSDGEEPPRRVADRAAAAGVELFCLTDHDTWSGHAETVDVAPAMRVLRGMELSCDERGRSVHLLLYGLEDGPGLVRLGEEVATLQRRRHERIGEICARFVRWNIVLDPAAVIAEARGGTPGRPHVAAALVRMKIVSSIREAFDRFLKDGGPADVPSPRLPVVTGVELGRAAGARVSLAHPHTVGHPEIVEAMCRRAQPAGLEGIEACYGPYAQRERAGWLDLAARLGLVVTAGSDYHGAKVTPQIPGPGVELSAPHEARLRAWLGVA
jgi:predicted metal-dependent phosphoesterase TrpH